MAVETIPDLVQAAADAHGERIWLRTDDGELSFAAAAATVGRAIDRLREDGVQPGDRVALLIHNTAPDLLCWLAVSCLGAVAVTINPASSPAELNGLVSQVRPALRIDDPLRYAGDWRAPSSSGGRATTLSTTAHPDDIAAFIPTSGTTGRSKLVMQTHRAYAYAGAGFPYWMELTADDRLMTSLPLFHINAPAYSVMGSLACGAGLILLRRFSASSFLEAARRHGATEFNAIGAMLEILMRTPRRPDDAATDLRVVYTGPSPTREWQEQFEARFGLRVVCGYAMSESPYGLIWPRGGEKSLRTRPFGTLGSVRQHPTLGEINQAKVLDGELLLRNPVITPGYFEMPAQTAETIVDGWLHTGDLVTDNGDGTYTFLARKKEVLRRRGENLSPAEVEEAIASHPAVVECAVVGVPSDLTEEEVKAFVVLRADSEASFAELHDWAAQRLTSFKVPRFWQRLDRLPRTPTARVAKHQLPSGHPREEYDADPSAAVPGWTPP